VEVLLLFEANSGAVRRTGNAIDNARLIGIAPKGLEAERVGFRAAKAKRGHQMQTKEMAAVRPKGSAGPSATLKMLNDPQITGNAVTVDRIKE